MRETTTYVKSGFCDGLHGISLPSSHTVALCSQGQAPSICQTVHPCACAQNSSCEVFTLSIMAAASQSSLAGLYVPQLSNRTE